MAAARSRDEREYERLGSQGTAGKGQHAAGSRRGTRPAKRSPLPPVVWAHDVFNLVFLAVLNSLNVSFLLGHIKPSWLLATSAIYFLADLCYVGIFPACVKSPNVILIHHLVSLCLIMIPIQDPKFTWCLAYCMLVEINTWLLIAKRTITVGQRLMQVGFYITWVALRCVWYPVLVWVFYKEWRRESQALGTPWNLILITPIFQSVLVGLNFHWTFALFRSRWFGTEAPKQL